MDWNLVVGLATGALVLITGYYAYLTHRLVRENAAANRFQQAAFEKQVRLTNYPQLFCGMSRSGHHPILSIYNLGDNGAYDVDILLVAVISVNDVALSDFVETHVEAKYQEWATSIGDRLLDGGFYGVFRHFVYYAFPPRQKAEVPLVQPIDVDSFYLCLQFRDGVGTNYCRVYWFFGTDTDRFALGSIEPVAAVPTPRLSYDVLEEGSILACKGGEPLPSFLVREFEPAFRASISTGYTRSFNQEVEDPGDWSDL